MHGVGKLDVVVAIDAQDVLDHVARATNVDTVGGHDELHLLVILGGNFHLQTLDDVADGVVGDVLTDEAGHVVVAQFHGEAGEVVGLDVDDVAADFASCQFLDEHGGEF